MLKRIIALVGVLAFALVLSLSTAMTAQAWTKNDNNYFKIIRAQASDLNYVSKTTLRKSATVICKFLRSGGTALEAVETAENTGLDTDTSLALVAGAITFYCPEEEAYL